jgi:polar amino acid transport system permease protein
MTALESHLPVSRDVSIVKLRHPLRWLSGAVLLVILAILVDALVTNERFGWDIVGHYLFSHQILVGLRRTLWLTLIAMLIGLVLGTVLAIMRMSTNPVAQVAAGLYIWFFRGTPLLVQLIFWYNLSALYPKLSFGIPFGPTFADVQTNSVLTVFLAAILGLGLNESAYMSEIIRAGLLSVDPGQKAAAEALGMRDSLIFRRIVWPQAMRVIVPPVGNQVIGMLKYTSLVSVIALPELLYSAQLIYQQNFQTIPLLMVASIWYLAVTSILSVIQGYIERRYGRGLVAQSDNLRLRSLIRQLRARSGRTQVEERAL